MSDFKKEMDDKLASSQHQQDIIIIIIIIIIKNIWTLQTPFLSSKIAIFWRIAPSCSFLTEYKMKAPENKFGPCKRCFLLWKLTFSVASSPYLSLKNSSKFNLKFSHPCKPFFSDIFCCIVPLFFIKNMKWKLLENFLGHGKRCFPLWKLSFSVASSPSSAARNSLCRYNRISPSRNSLCRENRIRGARAARTAGYAE